MNLTIRYHCRTNNQTIELEIPADVVAIKIPEQEGLPALTVNVNTDAVIVDAGEKRLSMYEFTDLYAEAEADEV